MDNLTDNTNYDTVLKQFFKLDSFRPLQLDIIKQIIEFKKDVLAIMFTGAGKSLLYQYPPIYLKKQALVISPLISLMNDQQMKLESLNINSCCLNSTIPNKSKIKTDIQEGVYSIIYTTPEFIVNNTEYILDIQDNLCLICIDEAHSISSFGHEFRPAYKSLDILKNILPTIPILAVTATATPVVQQDIITSLKLNDPHIVKTTFNRDNLLIKIVVKSGHPLIDIRPYVKNKQPTIIYSPTRALTETLCKYLTDDGILCDFYHAGMSASERKRVHETFAKGETNCVIATCAFGMGIDITIRNVIHYGVPKDMESYYQEIGRAGRDHKMSECVLMYEPKDFSYIYYILGTIKDEKYRNQMFINSGFMKKYVYGNMCRRGFILNYFGETYDKECCNMCDICIKNCAKVAVINDNNNDVVKEDVMKEITMLFKTMAALKSKFGLVVIIYVLRGNKNKKVPEYVKTSDVYGIGAHRSELWWREFIRKMINEKYITEYLVQKSNGCVLGVTDKFINAIKNNEKIDIVVDYVVPKSKKKTAISVITYKSDSDSTSEEVITKSENDNVITEEQTVKVKRPTIENTYKLLQEGMSVKDIAKKQNMVVSTIENHIEKLYKNGYDIDVTTYGLDANTYEKIKNKLSEYDDTVFISKIKNELPGVTYLQIKLAKVKMSK